MVNIPRYELEFNWAIDDGDLPKIKDLLDKHPELKSDRDSGGLPRVIAAVKSKHEEVFRFCLTLGFDLNTVGVPPYGGTSALLTAIDKDRMDRAKALLEAGASPNVERPLIAAMKSRFSPQRQLEYIKLFLSYGADVNRLYPLYGDETKSFSALDWAPNEEVRKFLLACGALPSKEIKLRKLA
jgi:ankyrin repeat protein